MKKLLFIPLLLLTACGGRKIKERYQDVHYRQSDYEVDMVLVETNTREKTHKEWLISIEDVHYYYAYKSSSSYSNDFLIYSNGDKSLIIYK